MEFQRDPVAMLYRGWQEHGNLYQFRLGHRQFVLFSGPEAHDAYFRASEDVLDAKSVYQFTIPIFGRGVAYDVAPQLMDEQLGFLYPALREAALRRFVRIMYEETELYGDSLGNAGILDLPTAMNELTVNIASRCFLGEEVRREVDSGFAAAYHDLQNGINTLGFFMPRLPTPGHRARDQARREVGKLFARIMAERRESGEEHEDFMYALMQARYKSGRALTDDEITGILVTALFAGQHTSAVLATWVGLELMRDAAYLDSVRTEFHEVYESDPTLSFTNLKKQEKLEFAVRECERLHPPLILLLRKVLKSFDYNGKHIPANAFALVSPAVSHRLPVLFQEPERFNPNRFGEPFKEDKQALYTLIAFGGGKHQCMGKHFALLQIKAIWSVLLDRFEFSLDTPFPAPNYGSWVTGPKLPCELSYQRRNSPTLIQ